MGNENESTFSLLNDKISSLERQINGVMNNNEIIKLVNITLTKFDKLSDKHNALDKHVSGLTKSIENIEQNTRGLSGLAQSLSNITDKVEELHEETKQQRVDITDLKNKPEKVTYGIVTKALWIIFGGAIGILFAWLSVLMRLK
jgi:uncharacterized protein YdcH (DUF465 family)